MSVYVYMTRHDTTQHNTEEYQTACLQQNEPGQGALINLILQNYIAAGQYALALKFVGQARFCESCETQQFARYHYYRGRMDTIRLQYKEALFHMQQAIRRAPQSGAYGFKVLVTKWLITVHLLMGDIPEKALFTSIEGKQNEEQLEPYLQITECVRTGDLPKFTECLDTYNDTFDRDGLAVVLLRLRHNVIRTGLRKINKSYSKISLDDVAAKLSLESSEDAYYIVAKVIRDGMIDARIDYENKIVYSRELPDVYSTNEPYSQLAKRVRFCLDIHTTAVKALRYPAKDDEDADKDKDKDKEEMKSAEEIADAIRKAFEEEEEE